MPASNLAEIEREVVELERLCEELEKNLVAGEWETASAALQESRRATHGFVNALEAGAGERDPDFDAAIAQRLRRVYDLREDQLARLQAFHDQIGERLNSLSRWKAFARSIGAKKAPPQHTVGLDRTR